MTTLESRTIIVVMKTLHLRLIPIFLSIAIHLTLLWSPGLVSEKADISKPHRFNISNIKTIGVEQSHKKSVYIPLKKEKNLLLSDLKIEQTPIREKQTRAQKFSKNRSAIKNLKLSNNDIKGFLKTTPTGLSSSQMLEQLKSSDVAIELELPKGVKEDELNKKELVFYSFQRRTVLAYINSFQKELNEFSTQNPHLTFPLTSSKELMSGRVTYDKDGNILKIQTVKWTEIQKLQTFFMGVLKNMNSLQNPPKEITNGENFSVYFSLSINNG